MRVAIFVIPIVVATFVTTLAGRVGKRGDWTVSVRGAWLLLMFCVASVVARIASKFMQRLLPLSALCQANLSFPEVAPNRVKLALRTGNTANSERVVQEFREQGLAPDPQTAAVQVLELIEALNRHDRKTRGHTEKVRALTEVIAKEMGLPEEERQRLRWASVLHDIGKLEVPAEILNKPGKPNEDEWRLIQSHPMAGFNRMGALRGWLGEASRAVEEHHERWDGTGYPRRLRGESIALAARIVAVADSFEVMTAARSYKKPMTYEDARAELVRCSGTHFDPAVVRAFLRVGQKETRFASGLFGSIFSNFVAGNGQVATAVQSVSTTMSASTGAVILAPIVKGMQMATGSAPELTFDAGVAVAIPAVSAAKGAVAAVALAVSTTLAPASVASTTTVSSSTTVTIPERLALSGDGSNSISSRVPRTTERTTSGGQKAATELPIVTPKLPIEPIVTTLVRVETAANANPGAAVTTIAEPPRQVVEDSANLTFNDVSAAAAPVAGRVTASTVNPSAGSTIPTPTASVASTTTKPASTTTTKPATTTTTKPASTTTKPATTTTTKPKKTTTTTTTTTTAASTTTDASTTTVGTTTTVPVTIPIETVPEPLPPEPVDPLPVTVPGTTTTTSTTTTTVAPPPPSTTTTIQPGTTTSSSPGSCAQNQWRLEVASASAPSTYFCESAVSRQVAAGIAPAAGHNPVTFNLTWTGTFTAAAATAITFQSSANNALEVLVDGQRTYRQNHNQGARPLLTAVSYAPLTVGAHTVVVRFVSKSSSGADVSLSFTALDTTAPGSATPKVLDSTPAVIANGPFCPQGFFAATYLNTTDFSGPVYGTGCESTMSNVWVPNDGQAADLNVDDSFSADHSGDFVFAGGVTNFQSTSDAGMRVWVDGSMIVSNSIAHSESRVDASVYLTPGVHRVVVRSNNGVGLTNNTLVMSPAPASGVAPVHAYSGFACGSGQWEARYWTGSSTSGSPIRQECLDSLAIADVPTGVTTVYAASLRTQAVATSSAGYEFETNADGELRLLVDGSVEYEASLGGPYDVAVTGQRTKVPLASGTHAVEIRYQNWTSGSVVEATLDAALLGAPTGRPPLTWVNDPVAFHGCGTAQTNWSGGLFPNTDLSGSPEISTCTAAVNWTYGLFASPVSSLDFSARYSRTVIVPASERYRLMVAFDDSARIWVNGKQLLDSWTTTPELTNSLRVPMSAGANTITVEFRDVGFDATLRLEVTDNNGNVL